ncbi:MAG TPA: hypothetical protein VGG39_37505 [Polyangiaceae bacterium]
MNRTDLMMDDAVRPVARLHAELVDKATYLAERMTRLAERLGREGVDASVNELGEVQCLGADVDRLCALLHAARVTRELVRRVVEAGEAESR